MNGLHRNVPPNERVNGFVYHAHGAAAQLRCKKITSNAFEGAGLILQEGRRGGERFKQVLDALKGLWIGASRVQKVEPLAFRLFDRFLKTLANSLMQFRGYGGLENSCLLWPGNCI